MNSMMKNDLPVEVTENGIHYTLVGDYYFPTCMLTNEKPTVGKWVIMYERYLQEEHPYEYVRLIWSGKLTSLLESVQHECEARMALLVHQMAETEGVNEQMKRSNQLMWVQQVNNIRSRAEEIIIHEMM